MNNEQTKWVLDYEVRLNELFCEIDWDYNEFTSAKDFDPLDLDKDNFSAAGMFSSKFVDALEGGYFDCLFDTYYEKRLNAVVQAITVGFINYKIFHGDDTIHFYSSNKQLLFVQLLESRILKHMRKWD